MNLENLKYWANLPVSKRYNIVIAMIVITLCSVIVHYEKKVILKDEEHRDSVNSIISRYTAREAALEAKLEICNQNYLLYLQKSEAEYRELLFQAKRLKEKIEHEDVK